MNITPEGRITAYNSKFPPALNVVKDEMAAILPTTLNGRIYGVWVIGNNYGSKQKLYGEYPHSVLARIMALFPDKRKILHLFSGTIQGDGKTVITYDLSDEFKPNIKDDVKNITKHKKQLQDCDLAICDPPYDKDDFAKYGMKPFNKAQVIRDLAVVLKKGSHLVWLDTKKPMYRKDTWSLLAEIMVSVSTNHRYRGLCIFEKL